MGGRVRESEPATGAYLIVGAIALSVRLAMSLSAPGEGGDSSRYFAIAFNIVRNGCVSLSDPASAACEPNSPLIKWLFPALTPR